jgi:DNA-binding XRE family transcriptional regulator
VTVQEWIDYLGMTQMDLVKSADISPTTLRRLERGEPVRKHIVSKVVRALNKELARQGEGIVLRAEDLDGIVISNRRSSK